MRCECDIYDKIIPDMEYEEQDPPPVMQPRPESDQYRYRQKIHRKQEVWQHYPIVVYGPRPQSAGGAGKHEAVGDKECGSVGYEIVREPHKRLLRRTYKFT